MIKYDPVEHALVICTMCGAVSEKDIIKKCTRDENDAKIAHLECPVCYWTKKVAYDY